MARQSNKAQKIIISLLIVMTVFGLAYFKKRPDIKKQASIQPKQTEAVAPTPEVSAIPQGPAEVSEPIRVNKETDLENYPPELQKELSRVQQQLAVPPTNLPEEFRRQLEEPPPPLPEDLQRQLDAPPPEIPEDIKRSMNTPPRVATIEEVNGLPVE